VVDPGAVVDVVVVDGTFLIVVRVDARPVGGY
jgi:hypothetical protein